jgi:hypothetical protein
MIIHDEVVTVESLKRHLDFVNQIKERGKAMAPYWIEKIMPDLHQGSRPLIGTVGFNDEYMFVSFRVYIGCGDYDHHDCAIPLAIAIADDFKPLIDEHKLVLDAESLAEAHEEAIADDLEWTESRAREERRRFEQYEKLRAEFDGKQPNKAGEGQ